MCKIEFINKEGIQVNSMILNLDHILLNWMVRTTIVEVEDLECYFVLISFS